MKEEIHSERNRHFDDRDIQVENRQRLDSHAGIEAAFGLTIY
jgi:hypothetical protein